MSVLSDLLGAHEPGFTSALHELELSSGSPGADLQVVSLIAGSVHAKIRELGLDPMDTTGKELYHGLQSLIKLHDNFLMKALGGQDPEDAKDLVRRCVSTVNDLPIPKQCWVIKHSIAKRLIKSTPPKKVMKQLGYRSIDSMLKRENIEEIFVALYFMESQAWLVKFIKTYRSLKPSDFEVREADILQVSTQQWGDAVTEYVANNRHNIVCIKEIGVIGVLPLPNGQLQGICITIMPLLLHYINEIRLYSSYFKLQQVKPEFGRKIMETMLGDAKPVATMVNQPLPWRVMQRFYGKRKGVHPEIFQPYVQPEDIEWQQAEEVMYQIEPALKFWEDVDFVGAMYDNSPVSFNLIDNVLSYCNDLPYGQQASLHFRRNLWDELLAHYLRHGQLEEKVLSQLDSDMTESQISSQKGRT